MQAYLQIFMNGHWLKHIMHQTRISNLSAKNNRWIYLQCIKYKNIDCRSVKTSMILFWWTISILVDTPSGFTLLFLTKTKIKLSNSILWISTRTNPSIKMEWSLYSLSLRKMQPSNGKEAAVMSNIMKMISGFSMAGNSIRLCHFNILSCSRMVKLLLLIFSHIHIMTLNKRWNYGRRTPESKFGQLARQSSRRTFKF